MELVPPRQLDVGVVGCGFAVRHDAVHDWRVDSLQWWIRVAACLEWHPSALRAASGHRKAFRARLGC